MSDDHPWEEYRRDRLWSGTSFPLGRDHIEQALRDAGAVVGTLQLIVPADGSRPFATGLLAVTVDWFSDAQSGYLSNRDRSVPSHLLFRVWAVPADQRHRLQPLAVEAVTLAARWSAEAPHRGSAWTASSHLLTLHYRNGTLTVDES